MTPPIRRGTASRLALRTPYNRPPGPLRFPVTLPGAEFERFIARFREALNSDRYRTVLLGAGPTLTRAPYPERRP